jgi:Fe-S oxidoreductase
MDQRREVPRFAPTTLQAWFGNRAAVNPHGPRVVLFPDTFNNHFHLGAGIAGVEALEAAGWQVVMPEGHICCGRPLYDYGFLDLAERYLHRVLDMLRDEIRAGTPIVGLEPSCMAVFKDELAGMLPHDDDAIRLAHSAKHFGEFFAEHDVELPRLDAPALLWGHCHHKATGGIDSEKQLLERMGLQVQEASGGCCGLAGSWGFEEGRYDMSMACGEVGFLPAARAASDETLVVANGFSCSTQLEQSGAGRRALHAAEVMKLAREREKSGLTRAPRG